MEFLKIFLIVQVVFLICQLVYRLKLESFQYYELVFGSFFIIVFFGLFGSILTLDMMDTQPTILNNSALFAAFFAIWFYLTKKITNIINSDSNGVINF